MVNRHILVDNDGTIVDIRHINEGRNVLVGLWGMGYLDLTPIMALVLANFLKRYAFHAIGINNNGEDNGN